VGEVSRMFSHVPART